MSATVEQRLVDLHDEIVDVLDGLAMTDGISERDYGGAEEALTQAARAVYAALRAPPAGVLRRDLPPFRSEGGDGEDDEVRALRA